MKRKLTIILLLTLLVTSTTFAGDYIIGEGDGLDISVWGVKELNFSVTVRPDGKITAPGLGDVDAAGFTSKELTVHLTEKLKDLVKNPIVTVTVKDFNNCRVYVFGGGVPSGIYKLTMRTTLLQLLCTIGNPYVSDKEYKEYIHRWATNPYDYSRAFVLRNGRKIKEDFHKLFINGDTAEDIVLEPNDSVFIPPFQDRNVYVLGAVNTSKAIEFRQGMTAIEAILEAGGFTKFAKQNDVEILRKDGDKDITIPVRAKDLIQDADLKQNVKLKPGDYIIVKEGMF